MPRRYSTGEIIKVLVAGFGWTVGRDKRHVIMTKDGRASVPLPKDRSQVRAGTMGSILRQAGIQRRDFEEAARRLL